jgi:hypothetical protein
VQPLAQMLATLVHAVAQSMIAGSKVQLGAQGCAAMDSSHGPAGPPPVPVELVELVELVPVVVDEVPVVDDVVVCASSSSSSPPPQAPNDNATIASTPTLATASLMLPSNR